MLDLPEVIKREIVTLSEVKKILETIPMDEMDQIQRWTFDYSKKFSKVDYEQAKEMADRLAVVNHACTDQCKDWVMF